MRQKGSYIILVKETAEGTKSTVVPLHKEVDKVANVIMQKGSPGTRLLVHSYIETIDDVKPLRLVEMMGAYKRTCLL